MKDDDRDARISAYLAGLPERPRDLDTPAGGVRIATDPAEIARIETTVAARYEARGWSGAWAKVGVAYRDPYLTLLRDAVVFDGGREAVHHRVIYGGDPSGAAILPLYRDGIVLIRQFRHPSRAWHHEIPRGGIEPGQTAEHAAREELREEIGAEAGELIPLGFLHGSNSLISTPVALFAARIDAIGPPCHDEGIGGSQVVSIGRMETMIRDGEITDCFTVGAFAKARLRGIV